jgi:hypothetical protein
MCLTDGILRMKLDGELNQAESLAVDDHLATCGDCRQQLEFVAARTEHVGALFSVLSPPSSEPTPDARMAYARFKARHGDSHGGRTSMFQRILSRPSSRVWGTMAAAAAVVAVLFFAPTGAWAERVLELFRIKQVSVVAVNMERLDGHGERLARLLSDDVVITKEPEKRLEATSIEEASELAGFKVRSLSGRADVPQLWVQDRAACQMTINLSKVQDVLAEFGRSDIQLPASLDGATVAIDFPRSVMARYETGSSADPWSGSFMLYQTPTPTVVTPPDLNLAEIAMTCLQLAGWSAEEAQAFSQTVDWTSTLVVPIPADVTSHETVDVDGVKGTLVTESHSGRRPAKFMLLWVKQGIIYALSGYGDPADAISMAGTLE